MSSTARISILGAGNIGRAIAQGLSDAKVVSPGEMILTRRRVARLDAMAEAGFQVQADNRDAVRRSRIVLVAVEPQELDALLAEIRVDLEPKRHVLVSVVSGASIESIVAAAGEYLPIVRAMPNTAIALGKSMTCLASNKAGDAYLKEIVELFDAVGATLVVREEQMVPATALCACGIAFFLRAIRAASQGGVEIGFHAEEALQMASQTALGAASLLLANEKHPESEIDRVATPRGCTIAGLNEMEHHGFSSTMIRGITRSADKAGMLHK